MGAPKTQAKKDKIDNDEGELVMTDGSDKKQALEQFINACHADQGEGPIELESYEKDSSQSGTTIYRVTIKGGGAFELTIINKSKC